MSILNYFKETKGEMKHVSWPTKKQSINFTLLVIGISLLTAFTLGFFDFLFTLGLEKVVENRSFDYRSAVNVSTSTGANGMKADPIASSTLKFDLDL